MTAKKSSEHKGSDKLDGSKLKENPGPMPYRRMTFHARSVGPEYEIVLKVNERSEPQKIGTASDLKETRYYCAGFIKGLGSKVADVEFVLTVDIPLLVRVEGNKKKPVSEVHFDRGLRKGRHFHL